MSVLGIEFRIQVLFPFFCFRTERNQAVDIAGLGLIFEDLLTSRRSKLDWALVAGTETLGSAVDILADVDETAGWLDVHVDILDAMLRAA